MKNRVSVLPKGRVMTLGKAVAALLATAMLSGCATSRRVYFTSEPSGAQVFVGSGQGTTPCALKIPEGAGLAVFHLPSGQKMRLSLPEMDRGLLDNAGEVGGKALGVTLKVAGGLVFVAGLGVVVLAWAGNGDDGAGFGDNEDDGADCDALGIGLGMLLGGAGVFALGDWIYPDDELSLLHAEFPLFDE